MVAYAKADPWYCVRLAASIGNDSDSIAAMAGAIAGVFAGLSGVPTAIKEDFERTNADFDLRDLSATLTRTFLHPALEH
ncbi:ADP-ribosylglycohydrolase [compost metagenome]